MKTTNASPGRKVLQNILLAIAVLLMATCKSGKEEGTPVPFKEGLQLHLDALKNKDIAKLEPTVGNGVVMIGPDGDTLTTKTRFMEFHKNWFSSRNWEWNYTVLQASSDGNLGYALLQYQYIQKDDKGMVLFASNNYLVLIFKRSEDGWQLVHDQNTRIPDEK